MSAIGESGWPAVHAGAHFGAAAAAHAGVGVEKLLPGEVLELARAEARARLDQGFDIAHGGEVKLRGRALEERVYRGENDVPELRDGHQREQPERRDDVEPPPPDVRIKEGLRPDAESVQGLRDEVARGRPLRPVFVAGRDFARADAQAFDEDASEEHEAKAAHNDRVLRAAPVPRQLVRRGEVAAVDRHPDTDEADHAEEVAHKAVAKVDRALEEGVLGIGPEDDRQVVIDGEQRRDDG
jgi:hypothetical protein